MPRQAVGVALAGVGQADVAPVADPGQAHAAGVGLVVTAVHPAALRPTAAHPVVAGVALHPFSVDGDVAAARSDLEGPGNFTSGTASAQLHAAFQAVLGHGGGDLAVQHIDHATHRAAAVGQRRRPAQHLDLLRQHGLHGHGVVGADGGGVVHFRAVRQHFHPRAVHAADDGPAGTCTEVAGTHARLPLQRLAQRGGAAQHQRIALQHGDRGGHLAAAQGQAAGGDGDFLQGGALGFVGGLSPGPRGGQQRGHSQGQWVRHKAADGAHRDSTRRNGVLDHGKLSDTVGPHPTDPGWSNTPAGGPGTADLSSTQAGRRLKTKTRRGKAAAVQARSTRQAPRAVGSRVSVRGGSRARQRAT